MLAPSPSPRSSGCFRNPCRNLASFSLVDPARVGAPWMPALAAATLGTSCSQAVTDCVATSHSAAAPAGVTQSAAVSPQLLALQLAAAQSARAPGSACGTPRWPVYTNTCLYRTARAPDIIGVVGRTKLTRRRCAIKKAPGWDRMDTLGFEPRALRMRSGCDTTTPCAQWRGTVPGVAPALHPPPPFIYGAATSARATTVSRLKRLQRSRRGPVLSGVPVGRPWPRSDRSNDDTKGGRRAATGALCKACLLCRLA